MMHDGHDDPILRHVSRLPGLTPDRQRADGVRARCRAKLAPPVPKKQRHVAPALLAGLCLLYLSAVVHDVLQLRGLL
jgi:hypothetical protein